MVYLVQKRRTSHPPLPTSSGLSPRRPDSRSNRQSAVSYGQEAPSSDATNSPLGDLQPAPILIRATDGKGGEKRKERVKLSTVVEPAALEAFYARYAEVCKAGMTALKPRDKSRKKAKAKKRRGGAAGS